MRALDTNVVVRLLTRDDVGQAATADAFIEGGAWISILALAEAIWVLEDMYERTSTDLAAALEMLLEHQNLVLQHSETVEAALDLFRSRPVLGFSDCLILELSRKAGHLPLGTFDRRLAKIDGTQKL
jgi:predicted nucleic-acid-binding protein